MTGKYDIEIYNKRVHYHLTVKRNITVIQGDSATGKTELLRMISDYENNGISSGITQICEKRCVVIENASWKERLATLQQCIIFIDEGAPFLRSKEFTRMVKGNDNYFVLVTRDSLEHLPYSIEEIYGMETAEIISGVVKETGPDVLIVVDALAARSTRRLNRTIQITK